MVIGPSGVLGRNAAHRVAEARSRDRAIARRKNAAVDACARETRQKNANATRTVAQVTKTPRYPSTSRKLDFQCVAI